MSSFAIRGPTYLTHVPRPATRAREILIIINLSANSTGVAKNGSTAASSTTPPSPGSRSAAPAASFRRPSPAPALTSSGPRFGRPESTTSRARSSNQASSTRPKGCIGASSTISRTTPTDAITPGWPYRRSSWRSSNSGRTMSRARDRSSSTSSGPS